MAKDPAFLFYPGDWQGGTSTFSRFLKGCYLDVLIAQFNSGHLSLEEIKTVLGSDFGQSWPALQKKFQKDNDGLFFNEKLDTEVFRRKEYSKSRADNRRGKTHVTDMKNISNTHVPHMETETVNEIASEIKKGVQGEKFSDEWFKSIFDDIHMGNVKTTFPLHNIDNEFRIFQLKVRGSPDEYRNRDTGGIRNAFNYQLQKSTSTNGNGTNKGRGTTKNNPRRADAIIEEGKDFGTL